MFSSFVFVFSSSDIFERLAKLEGDKPRVEMSFLEIYIENVYDLVAIADAVRVCV